MDISDCPSGKVRWYLCKIVVKNKNISILARDSPKHILGP